MQTFIALVYGLATFMFGVGATYHSAKSKHSFVRWLFTPLFGLSSMLVAALTIWFVLS